MITWALVSPPSASAFLSPKALKPELVWKIPPPEMMPSTVILPIGPASNTAGFGLAFSGPAIAGLAIGVAAGAAGAAAGAVAGGAGEGKAGAGWPGAEQQLQIGHRLSPYCGRPRPAVAGAVAQPTGLCGRPAVCPSAARISHSRLSALTVGRRPKAVFWAMRQANCSFTGQTGHRHPPRRSAEPRP